MHSPEGLLHRIVQDMDPNSQEFRSRVPVPTHLLALRHPMRNDLVDRRLGERRRDSLSRIDTSGRSSVSSPGSTRRTAPDPEAHWPASQSVWCSEEMGLEHGELYARCREISLDAGALQLRPPVVEGVFVQSRSAAILANRQAAALGLGHPFAPECGPVSSLWFGHAATMRCFLPPAIEGILSRLRHRAAISAARASDRRQLELPADWEK